MYLGSSPRVRGTHDEAAAVMRSRRFIPACAGNTNGLRPTVKTQTGSSPRVRGTRRVHSIAHGRSRFIPACAGNTTHQLTTCTPTSVHPRVCGEHELQTIKGRAKAGSSPRVRGTLAERRELNQNPRFIPACAGNTQAGAASPQESSVHPRVCGEHAIIGAVLMGTFRFIPACAGNTLGSLHARASESVHPRVRGEHPDVL